MDNPVKKIDVKQPGTMTELLPATKGKTLCKDESCNDDSSQYFALLELKKQQECKLKKMHSLLDRLKILKQRQLESLNNIRTLLKAAQISEAGKQEHKENFVGSPK